MFLGAPNLASVFGYTNASWTLRADLICEYVCRLLNKTEEKGADIAMPTLPAREMKPQPWLDFSSGYVQRAVATLPNKAPTRPGSKTRTTSKTSRNAQSADR